MAFFYGGGGEPIGAGAERRRGSNNPENQWVGEGNPLIGPMIALFRQSLQSPSAWQKLVKTVVSAVGVYGIGSIGYEALMALTQIARGAVSSGLENLLYAVTTNEKLANYILTHAADDTTASPSSPVVPPPPVPPVIPPPPAPGPPVVVNVPAPYPLPLPVTSDNSWATAATTYAPYVLGGLGVAGIVGLGLKRLFGGNDDRRREQTRSRSSHHRHSSKTREIHYYNASPAPTPVVLPSFSPYGQITPQPTPVYYTPQPTHHHRRQSSSSSSPTKRRASTSAIKQRRKQHYGTPKPSPRKRK